MQLDLRQASLADADAIAAVFSPSRRLLKFLPELHTVDEDRWFIENVILKECEVTVVEVLGVVISFLARHSAEIRLLHTHPNRIGEGAGSLLVHHAKARRPGALELWCFQANDRARRFYERHGFNAIHFSNGDRNEERMPDVRYRWAREAMPTRTGSPGATGGAHGISG
jgi:N-acetylglutamate synthase-like GNAT family acetyltransferase